MKLVKELKALPSASHSFLLSRFLSSFFFTWPIFILYMSNHFSIASVGVYLSANALAQMLSEIPTGYLADRIGQAKSVLLGSAISALSLFYLVSNTHRLTPLIAGIAGGIGAACISGAADALIYRNITHAEYEQTMHHDISIYQVGLISSSLIGGFLYWIAAPLPFIAQAIVIFMAAIPLLRLKEVYEPNEDQPSLKDAGRSLKRIVTTKASLLFLIGATLYMMLADIFINILLEGRMIELSVSPSGRGLIIGLTKIVVIVVLQLFVIQHVRTVKRKLYLTLAMMLTVFPLMGFGHSAGIFVVLYFFFNFMTFFGGSVTSPMAQRLVSSRYRATELSLYSMARSAAFAIGALLVALYLSGHSTRGVFLALSAITLLIAAPLLLWSLRHYQQSLKEA